MATTVQLLYMLDGGADADAKNDGRSKVELNKAIIKMPHDTYIGYYFYLPSPY